ncbi:MAG: biotin/lipoyl-binding protein [Odoribacter sp.]|nr:biotin/lipoyl-binding protein [Odoribacter sp.]
MSKPKYEKLQLNGAEYKTIFPKKWLNRKQWVAPDPCRIEAYIPGTILKINVKEGDEVQGNDVLLILQAMKMDNKITAPFSAKVKKIHVSPGEKVTKGALMIELEE